MNITLHAAGHIYMYISLIFSSFFLCRYIKGRISYEQVNNAIDEIHKAITAKYKIMRLPRSAMGEPVMKKYKVREWTQDVFWSILLVSEKISMNKR